MIPPEVAAKVLDHLDVPQVARCAQVSLLWRDAAYDDGRWVARLRAMGVWSEDEARRRVERKSMRQSRQVTHNTTNGYPPDNTPESPATPSDTSLERQRHTRRTADLMSLKRGSVDKAEALYALENVRSIRGKAMQEFARVWIALHPFYGDLTSAADISTSAVFREYRQPEDQARMLQQLVAFGRCHPLDPPHDRNAKLTQTTALFESAALREFEIAYDARNEAVMKRYASVVALLNRDGGKAAYETFARRNPILQNPPPNPFACFNTFEENAAIDLSPFREMVATLGTEMISQRLVMGRVFDDVDLAWRVFAKAVFDGLLSGYMHKLLDYAQQQGQKQYLVAVTGTYQQLDALAAQVQGGDVLLPLLQDIYQDYVSFYLEEEATVLKSRCRKEVDDWDRRIKQEAQETETLLLSGINREVAKKNFLQSFAKVMLMPVNAVGNALPFRPQSGSSEVVIVAEPRPSTGESLPTTEQAARDAIADSGLARIKRLLSLEVALQLVHHARESIDRARTFISMTGRPGTESREACEGMFADVLSTLSTRHVTIGFDLALDALRAYNPRERRHDRQVQPLVDFLELVHVGDLVQQMFELFFERELVGVGIVHRSDFLSPANKEKKRLEQLIDGKVAEGLNRGIDVLIGQVDYILVTTQKPEDFRPWVTTTTTSSGGGGGGVDLLSATETARAVISCLRSHTDLLRGATDKSTLDVFLQEVCVRFYNSLSKHLKRQTVTVEGGLTLIADLNYYADWVASLKQTNVQPYFAALKHVANVFIISGGDGRAVGQIVSDAARFGGVMRPEDVYEFVERRADWARVKKDVDRVLYGTRIAEDCVVM